MSYVHGVEIKTLQSGNKSITTINSSVVGLVGIAKKGVGLHMITSLSQATEAFGDDVAGTTIMSALKSIFDVGGTTCMVLNVGSSEKMDPLFNTTGVNAGKTKLVNGKYASQIYEATMGTGSGLADFTAEVVMGLDSLLTCESVYGVKPKLIIAPGFSQVSAVMAKMATVAEKLRGKAMVDISADSVTNAIVARGTSYATANNRVLLCYPNVTVYNEYEATNVNVGLSQQVAAALVYRDLNNGYWYSPSSVELNSILGTAVPITSSLDDATADTNQLNAKGIVTVFRSYGTGYRVWGNWTAAFPTTTALENQIAPSRVKDVIDESVQLSSLDFMDGPVTNAKIDAIQSSVNRFISSLKSRGAIADGSCTFDKSKNATDDLAAGKVVFTITFAPSPSLDNITYESIVDSSLLKSLIG